MSPSRAERLAAILLIGGAFAVVLAVSPFRAFELDRFFFPKEVVLHATALTVALLVIPGRREWIWSREDLLLFGYLCLSCVSAAVAINGWLAARALGITWSSLLLFWSARELARTGLGRVLTIGLATGAVVGVLTALGQAYGILDSELLSLSRAPGGSFGNRNFVAHLAAIVLPALVAIGLAARTRLGYLMSMLGTLLSVGLLVLTRSRAAWLATAVAAGVFFGLGLLPGGLLGDRATRRRLIGQVLAAGAGVFLALHLPNTLDWRSDTPYVDTLKGLANYQEGSGRGRLLQWQNSLLLVRADPLLGVGPGNWAVVYPGVVAPDDPSLDSHGMTSNPWPSSDWVAVMSERGPVALLLLLGAGGVLLLAGGRAWLSTTREPGDLRALTLAGTLAATAIVGAFDAVLLLPVPALYVWSLVGANLPVDPLPRRLPASPRARGVALVIVLLIGSALVRQGVRQVRAMESISVWGRLSTRAQAADLDPGSYRIQMMVAQSYRRRGRCADALPFARRAARLFPDASEPTSILRACGDR